MTLERALQRANDDVDALVEAWKLNPHPRISAVASQLPASAMFAGLFEGKLAEVTEKLLSLQVRRHPHLSNELERILREPPWSSNISREVWERVFALITESKDPRFHALAHELPSTWALRSDQKKWMTTALTNAVASIPSVAELTPEQSSLLTAIEREAFVAKPPPKRSSTIDFAAVYARPKDDGPRLVLADALLEQGAPRGEYLSLALRTEKSAAEKKREKELLKTHGKGWLAPFGAALGANAKWRRGFPSEGLVKFRDAAAVKKYGALPEWATFESLTWSPAKSDEHREAAGFIGPAFRHLLRADGPYAPHLLEGTWELTWLRCASASPEDVSALLTHGGLRQLRTLHLTSPRLEQEWISSIKNWSVLEELGVPNHPRPLLLHLLAAAEKTPLLRFQWGDGLRFHREADGALTRLELLDCTYPYSITPQLDSLPEGLVSSLVEPASAHWTAGLLGQRLERVLKKTAVRPSIAMAATRHLDLYSVESMAISGDKVFVSDFARVREVDARSFEVRASFPGRGGLLEPNGRDVLSLREQARVVLFDFSTSTERVIFEGKKLSGLTRSADGTRVALEQSGKVLVLDVATGDVLYTCDGADPVLDARGERMTVRSGGRVLHDLTRHAHQLLKGVSGRTIFLPDGRLANREAVGPVVIWRKPDDAFSLANAADVPWFLTGTADGSRFVLVQPSVTQIFDARGRVLQQAPGGDLGVLAPDRRFLIASSSALFSCTLP